MIIHIVQPGETVRSIAQMYGIPVDRILLDNGMQNENLVSGQALVILEPTRTYVVQSGDSLYSIARQFRVPVTQLIRNNIFLMERKDIQPGEELVISYDNQKGSINTFGYTYTYIDENVLKMTLPYLTYLCIYGIQITSEGELTEIDDSAIIQSAKQLFVEPILQISLTVQQDLKNTDATYFLITDVNLTNRLISQIVDKLKDSGYEGLCVIIEYLNAFNLPIYQNFMKNLHENLNAEGFELFVCISPQKSIISPNNQRSIEKEVDEIFDEVVIMDYNQELGGDSPPQPITSLEKMIDFLNQALAFICEERVNVGCPVVGIDWELPFIEDISNIRILKYYTSLELAYTMNSSIQFDPTSMTPYFTYQMAGFNTSIEHIVWFIDPRTIDAFMDLIPYLGLGGTGLWNVMYFFAPLWSIINSQFKINKKFDEMNITDIDW